MPFQTIPVFYFFFFPVKNNPLPVIKLYNWKGSYLLLQFHIFFDRVVQALNTNRKKYIFHLYMLETTQFNYQDLAKMYKEQTQIGYSKMLCQIALGHSQSSILNSIEFENKVLKLHEIMIPPLMSSVMNSEQILGAQGNASQGDAGRPEKNDEQKSEKTIQNLMRRL